MKGVATNLLRIRPMPEFLTSIADRLSASAHVKSVFGAPVETHGKTIIPVARVGYGFGGGSAKPAGEGNGHEGGGGGGAGAIPLGVFEITEAGTRFVPLHEIRQLMAAALFGFCLGVFVAKRARRR